MISEQHILLNIVWLVVLLLCVLRRQTRRARDFFCAGHLAHHESRRQKMMASQASRFGVQYTRSAIARAARRHERQTATW